MSQTDGVPEQFSGYAAHDEVSGKALDLQPYKYTPQQWSEALVDIKITHCSICGSCLHPSKRMASSDSISGYLWTRDHRHGRQSRQGEQPSSRLASRCWSSSWGMWLL
ncbi:hypothetical protein Pst134EA_009881 [Puccinia striiformis f. sp. tritici]|uniref:hypothetical protein n=1 Tax=Puccinia striiformis f. sp. tritici TaxID=168172 RepID=UPI002007D70D|nr:hypothetical protein Pst134EA_009881 [Puccinia striiformis f. sp. tritici]KAH9469360.1 hypothetical protein Pst134EA_009881 [Puccinia striiformis f. sp. tritici]